MKGDGIEKILMETVCDVFVRRNSDNFVRIDDNLYNLNVKS